MRVQVNVHAWWCVMDSYACGAVQERPRKLPGDGRRQAVGPGKVTLLPA